MMGESDRERVAKKWEDNLAPPIRPSKAELALSVARFRHMSRPRVLILGTTPELVDAAIANGAGRVVAMDWDESMLRAMPLLGREDWSAVESICSDWREPHGELYGSIDVVLGDGPFALLTFPDDWKCVFGVLRRYLAPGGLVIIRSPFLPEEPNDFAAHLDHVLSEFETRAAGKSMAEQRRLLLAALSSIRVGLVVAGVNPKGEVTTERRTEARRRAKEAISLRIGNHPALGQIDLNMTLGSEVDTGKSNLRCRAVPEWTDVKARIESWGFAVTGVDWLRYGAVSRAFCVFTAERGP